MILKAKVVFSTSRTCRVVQVCFRSIYWERGKDLEKNERGVRVTKSVCERKGEVSVRNSG